MPHGEAVAELRRDNVGAAGGFYDNERTFNGRVFKLRQHLERLYQGLESTRIDPGMSLEQMEAVTLDVLEANRPLLGPTDEFTITQVVGLGGSTTPEDKPKVGVMVYCQPLDFSAFAVSYLRGVRLITPITYGVPKPGSEASAKEGVQKAIPLMTNSQGTITECAGANFMFVKDSRIKLPDRSNVLPGVSMQTVLELAEGLGIPVDEGEYSPYHVYVAEEALVSSTRYCMLPVATLNGYRLGRELPGPITRRMLDAWRELVGIDFVKQALDHFQTTERS